MRSIGIGLSAWVFSIACATHAEAALRPFRFEELAKVERIGGFEVSPDGKWIAYAVGTPVIAENRVKSAIWLAPAAAGAPRPLTSGDKRDSDPAFSPDGRRVAFLSNRDGSSQIWTIGLSGGEPSKATSFPTQVKGFKWSPDGKWFVITSDVFPDCTDVACLDRRAKERAKSPTKARVAERLLFRHWDAWKEGLKDAATDRPDAERRSAARLIEKLYVQAAFYLPREFVSKREFRRAEISTGIAEELKPDRAGVAWYNLACFRATAGDPRGALDSLRAAVAKGFRDTALLETDPDLTSLRGEKDFRAIAEELKKPGR